MSDYRKDEPLNPPIPQEKPAAPSPTLEDLIGGAESTALVPSNPHTTALAEADDPGDELAPVPPESNIGTPAKQTRNRKAPTASWTDDLAFKRWLVAVHNGTPEQVEENIIESSHAAMVWKFREAALMGDYGATRAMALWLDRADKAMAKKPKRGGEKIVNPDAQKFMTKRNETE